MEEASAKTIIFFIFSPTTLHWVFIPSDVCAVSGLKQVHSKRTFANLKHILQNKNNTYKINPEELSYEQGMKAD